MKQGTVGLNRRLSIITGAVCLSFTLFAAACGGGGGMSPNANANSAAAPNLSPTDVTLASQPVGVTSAAQSITLSNTGNASLSVSSLTFTGSNPNDFAQTNDCGASVAPSGSCTISVTFKPAAAGSRSATLTLNSESSSGRGSARITGTGMAPAVTLSPSSLTFTSQAVGVATGAQAVTLTNAGNAALKMNGIAISGADAGAFAETNNCGSSVAAGTSCAISVTFNPTATGTSTATLTFNDNASNSPQAAELSGTVSTTAVNIAPVSLTFAGQPVGASGAAQNITVTNTGNTDLNVSGITISGANSSDFGQTNNCGSSVAASASCSISVTFKPSAAGTRTAVIAIADSATGSPQTVSLSGMGASAAVSISPSSLTFGSQPLSTTSAPQTITVSNSGNATLSVSSIAISGANAGDFLQTNNCGSSVAAGASCVVSVIFRPLVAGTRTAAVMIADSATGSPQSVSLSGAGNGSSAVSVSPANLSFGSQALNTASAARTVTLSNSGSAALGISGVAVSGTNADDFTQTNNCGSSLAAVSSCTIGVIFKPTAAGNRTAVVSIADSATGSPQSISLSGTGAAAVAGVSPSSVAFGNQAVSTTSPAQTVTLSNPGNAVLSVTTIAVSGANAGDFSETNNCGSSVAAGASCSINITFKPGASGARSAAVTVADSAAGSPQSISLSGTGTVAAASVSPSSLVFGSQSLGASSAAQTLTLTNSGNSALAITGVTVSGANAGDFTQNNNCGSSVAVGGHCTLSVSFAPSAKGARSATLSFADNASGSPQTVSVSGTGVAVSASLSATSLGFGSLPVGMASPAQMVVLNNPGNAALGITSLTLSGANAGNFAQTNNCGSSVAAGASCTIRASFTPSAVGARVAAITVIDNSGGSAQSVSLAGTGTTLAPGQTISVVPSEDLQALVNIYPPTTTFSLGAGIYRLQSLIPQDNDSFVGQTGATLNGAELLTTFVPNGSYWTAAVSVTRQSSYPGSCLATSPACIYPEDLYFNNILKTRVAQLSEVKAGTWYLDYNAQTAYIGDDPTGKTVEMSELPYAFRGTAVNVNLSDLIIEKYAAVAQTGAIEAYGPGWTINNNEARYNHGRGISVSNSATISNNNVHHNGNVGIGGGGSGVTVSGNQVSYNNASGYDWNWEAGGVKFSGVTNLIVSNNTSTNNAGPGFWNDINSQTVTYTGNQSSGNVEAGIMTEISNGITITNNTIVNDAFISGTTGIWYGAGILISTSSNVTVSGNTVTNCMNGFSAIYADRGNNPSGVPYALQNVVAHNNTITQSTGIAMGLVTEGTENNSTAVFTSMGNDLSGNTFVLTNPATGLYFYWLGNPITLANWNTQVN